MPHSVKALSTPLPTALLVAATILPASTTTAKAPASRTAATKAPASSSSDSDSSSSDSDSDDDDGPEVQGTGPPVHRPPAVQLPPAKRARLMPSTSGAKPAASDSSDDSSGDSSSSGDSDSDEEVPTGSGAPKANGNAVASSSAAPSLSPITSTAVSPTVSTSGLSSHLPVAPGHGLTRTKSRNARKRALKAFKAAADAPSQSPSAPLPTPSPGPAGKTSLASSYVPPPAKGPKSKALPLDPYYDFAGPKLDMLHLASGNKNKKKAIHIPKDGRGKQATRTVFGAEDERAPAVEPPKSPRWTPKSPTIAPAELALSPAPVSTPNGKGKGKARAGKKPWNAGPAHPSERADLPPNVTVTVVDVEREGWTAGRGRVVEGTSSAWVARAKAPLAVLDVRGPGATVEDKAVEVKPVEATKPVEQYEQYEEEEETEGEWAGWPTRSAVERRFDALKPLSEADAGMQLNLRVAIKVRLFRSFPNVESSRLEDPQVLELDPATFSPTLALKYGRLVAGAEPLAIRLHPACRQWVDEYEYDGEEEEGEGDKRMRFGMDATDDGAGEVWEGSWGDVRVVD